MKKEFIRKIIAITIFTIGISTVNSVTAYAVWKKHDENKWTWSENGVKSAGWKLIEGKWYNFNNDGFMNTGWIYDNGKWYHLSDSGAMNTGWLKDSNNQWYYLAENGEMNIGWISEDKNWYYINSNGVMATGDLEINGSLYTFSNNGILVKSQSISSNVGQESYPNTNENNQINIDEKDQSRKAYVVTESNSLNIRAEASTSSSIIGSLPKGTKILVGTSENNGFLKVSLNDLNGWVSSEWISFDKPSWIKENEIIDKNDKEDIETDEEISDEAIIKDDEEKNDYINNSILKSIRKVAPEVNNSCYYSNSNIFYKIKLSPPYTSGGNCTWYAYGRTYEITGQIPTEAGFIGNGCEWWEANKISGKYKYGSTPKVGAIAVWKSSLPGSGGSGHVAIVENIEDNKIYISESMWHGGIFKYTQIYSTEYLYGYIYTDEANY